MIIKVSTGYTGLLLLLLLLLLLSGFVYLLIQIISQESLGNAAACFSQAGQAPTASMNLLHVQL